MCKNIIVNLIMLYSTRKVSNSKVTVRVAVLLLVPFNVKSPK